MFTRLFIFQHDFIGHVAGAADYAHCNPGDLDAVFDFDRIERYRNVVLLILDDFEDRGFGAEDSVDMACGSLGFAAGQGQVFLLHSAFDIFLGGITGDD